MPFRDRQVHWSLAHRVGTALLGFVLSACFASAQLVPPLTAIKWLAQVDGDWGTAGNWAPASVPDSGAAVLFGNVSGGPADPDEPLITVTNNADRELDSLWFDSAAGIFYTIGGTGTLTLGAGLADGGRLITVISNGGAHSETNINNGIVLDDMVSGRARWIVNHSQAGLRLSETVNLGSQQLRISGTGATHFSGSLSGTGKVSSISESQYATPHLILNANNSGWSGGLSVGVRTLVFVKADRALGTGATVVTQGGTLGFRSHGDGPSLDYSNPAGALSVRGFGAARQVGKLGIGAIYHDGGNNLFSGDITLAGSTYFGARGDSGGLTLSGAILGSGFFYKIGSGLITLTNPNSPARTISIDQGVLRITEQQHVAGAIRFAGAKLLYPDSSGILELSGNVNSLTLEIGTGAGRIQWRGAGGFSAFGGDRSVTLNAPGALVYWGRHGFVSHDRTLFLSSRYADSKITLNNSIELLGYNPIYVARGVSYGARAEISGALTGTNGWFHKVGPGRLDIIGTNTYRMPTDISEGVLVGHIPDASNLYLGGGVLGLESDFTRDMGSGAKQIRWEVGRSGGFAGYGGDHAVRLNGTTAQIDWETNHFVKAGDELRFGHYTADGTVLWDKQLGLGTDGHRTIRVERGLPAAAANRADVSFTQALSGTGGSLTLKGDGRLDLAVDNADLKLDEIRIHGAELRLQQAGRITAPGTHFILKNGGALVLDNLGTHNATTGGSYQADRLHDDSEITLTASTLRYQGSDAAPSEERVGTLILEAGASAIDVQSSGSATATLNASSLTKNLLATANLTLGTLAEFVLNSWAADYSINDGGGTAIAPWLTVNGKDWATPIPSGMATTLSALSTYESGDQGTWGTAHNIALTAAQTLGGARAINSLKLATTGALNLGNFTLTLNSGGLLSIAGGTLSGTGRVNTAVSRPLYVHVYGADLTLSGGIQLDVPRLVKTGGGRLTFNTSALHNLGRLHLHQGTVDLQQGRINASHIVVGDGAGKDSLILPANTWEPLANKPEVTLHGTPYGPGAEYASYNPDEAILRLSGNTKQHLTKLTITDRGTIDWSGGEVATANFLWIDELEFNNADARLFMRNWYEYEDYFLISRTWLNSRSEAQRAQLLSQIIFDGYQDFPVLAEGYDANYFMITPFNAPEPATYGAILGAVGIGLVAWRKRSRQQIKERADVKRPRRQIKPPPAAPHAQW